MNELYDFLAFNEITRSDCLVALGGGVVGDLTGYASATFLRGIDFIQIPTTLLAQVDSSIGGKTAIDIPAGKNLVGAFKQPLAVICDTSTLSTLNPEFFSDGMGEVVKYAMIRSYELFEILTEKDIKDNLEDVICRCIDIKRQIVENDEFDKGERMLLNFGHTFGHAIEKIQNFTGLSHGSAVSVGMCIITKLAIKQGLCSQDTYENLKNCLKKYNLPLSVDISYEELVKHCVNDKKRDADYINLVISTEIGKSELRKVPINSLFD
ncbi:MAG: 3-dehydroquinate synthase [Oscillospiraceae bacterium]|nr:3-dehydroquinate synthase [Oscillospiraceae bacterium]